MDDNLDILLKCVVAVGGLCFLGGGIFMARDSILIRLRHGLASGRVASTRFIRRRGSDSDRDSYVRIRFETAGGTQIQFEQAAPGGFFTIHTASSVRSLEGQKVRVHYDTANPNRATITLMRDLCAGVAFALAGLFVLGAAIFY
ncbi:MAG: DUF3592 domain-containing protein [Rhodobacteraceae bacterium]|nr:DUF3592 domain-containing protein [Paracoccaceae bacterium]